MSMRERLYEIQCKYIRQGYDGSCICKEDKGIIDNKDYGEGTRMCRLLCVESVNAILDAMMVPTPEMLENVGCMNNFEDEGYETADADHTEWWQAMLTAAKEE